MAVPEKQTKYSLYDFLVWHAGLALRSRMSGPPNFHGVDARADALPYATEKIGSPAHER